MKTCIAQDGVDVCDVRGCKTEAAWLMEGGAYLCSDHFVLTKKYVCRHCKVQILSKKDLRPVLGKEHAKHCPRSKQYR